MDRLEKKMADWLLEEVISRGENSRSAKFGLTISEAKSRIFEAKIKFFGNLSDFEAQVEELGFKVGPALTKSGQAHKSTRVIYL